MNADQIAVNIERGETGDPNSPFEQGWMSRIRARKVLGDNVNKKPFTRAWGAIKTVASCMGQDKLTAVADAVGWRRVNTDGATPTVVDVGDILLIQWEYFKLTADPVKLKQAVENAKKLEKWPVGYTGIADFEAGT